MRGMWDATNICTVHTLLASCVQCKTPDDRQRNRPKHVEFHSKNKFEKLVHLVGFIMRRYHDARPSECQMLGNIGSLPTLHSYLHLADNKIS